MAFFVAGFMAKANKDMRPETFNKKLPPYAVCTLCGHFAYSAAKIKTRCSQVVNKKRCEGIYRPALMREDWKECLDCGGTGRIAKGRCGRCHGVGWLYIDNNPKPKQEDEPVQPELFQNLKTSLKPIRGKG